MRRLPPFALLVPAALAGLLTAMACPAPDLPLLAWFGLAPLVVVMRHRPFKSGFVAGFFFFAAVLYWLNIVMTTYGRLPLVVSLAAYLLLVAYLSLFWGCATWAACRLREVCGYSYALTLPVLWVALELLRAIVLTGFPWASLGYSQQAWLPVIQSADLFGVYGIGYLLILSNTVVAECWLALRDAQGQRAPIIAMLVFGLLLAANLGYGHWRLTEKPVERPSLNVGLVQGNVPQDLKWSPAFLQQTLDNYKRLSRSVVTAGGSDLLVWPEAATPFYYQDGGPLSRQVDSLAIESGSSLLFGSPAYRQADGQIRFLNSAFLLDSRGRLTGRSDKIHLVPFGEYVPLGRFLPFIHRLVVGIGDFSPGEVSPLPMNGHSIGVLVCYEAIFPELAREWVRRGSDLLVNVTNDAWFGRSSAPYQHLEMTRFRAVENRIWIARAANTGISAFIAPSGRIAGATSIFESRYLKGRVGLGAVSTLYNRIGDTLPAAFLLLAVVWLAQTLRRTVRP